MDNRGIDRLVITNLPCFHRANTGFSFETGILSKTFTWCRRCGAILIPNVPEFVASFRNLKLQTAVGPDGQTIREFLWVLPDRFIAE